MTIIAHYDFASDMVEHYHGVGLAAAAEAMVSDLDINITADHYVTDFDLCVFRDLEPEKFWLHMLSVVIGGNDDWAYGDTAEEAEAGLAINNRGD